MDEPLRLDWQQAPCGRRETRHHSREYAASRCVPSNRRSGRGLADLLSNAAIATKLNKLRNHPGVSERHLAIGVSDIYGSGFDLLDNLKMGRRDLPKFEIPDGFAATHLWLTAGGYSILTWNRADGWIWRELPEPD